MTNETNSKKSNQHQTHDDDGRRLGPTDYWMERAKKAEKELETIKAFASFWQPQSIGQRLYVIASRLAIEIWDAPAWAKRALNEAHDEIVLVTLDMREGRGVPPAAPSSDSDHS